MFSRWFKKRKKIATASIAKERLQIIVAHERVKNTRSNPDFLTDLQRDILAVVRKYIPVDSEQIKVAMDQEDGCDVLELNIVLSDISENPEHILSGNINGNSKPETVEEVNAVTADPSTSTNENEPLKNDVIANNESPKKNDRQKKNK